MRSDYVVRLCSQVMQSGHADFESFKKMCLRCYNEPLFQKIDSEFTLIRIYSNESSLSVNHMKNILESNGISCHIKNESMQGLGIGELGMCWPELWIKEANKQDEAKMLIEDALANIDESEEDWTCESCSEINEGTFNVCWNCCVPKAVVAVAE